MVNECGVLRWRFVSYRNASATTKRTQSCLTKTNDQTTKAKSKLRSLAALAGAEHAAEMHAVCVKMIFKRIVEILLTR